MFARSRHVAVLLVAVFALMSTLAWGVTSAHALQATGSTTGLVCGVVTSVGSRVVPGSGVIVTDVQVAGSPLTGGAGTAAFTMEGGQVGGTGMWTEDYAELHIGDPVIAKVSRQGGRSMAIAAPIVGAGSTASTGPGIGSVTAATLAGYLWDGLHWADASLPVPYLIDPAGLPAGATSAIAAAAQTWEDDPGSYMDYTYAGSTSRASGVQDGVNVVGAGPVDSSDTVALCRFWYETWTEHIVEFDISYNTAGFTFATDGRVSAYDIQGIATHEFGHTLHLQDLYDASDAAETMYGYGVRGDTAQRTLGTGDVAGIRAIYPTADRAPVVTADSATVAEDGVLSVAAPGVLGNDSDPDGDPLSASLIFPTTHGELTFGVSGAYSYRPDPDFHGVDRFTYRANDGSMSSAPATVTIVVTSVNDAPVATADSASVVVSGLLNVAAPGVLDNDADVDGDALRADLVYDVSNGTLMLNANGSYSYRPNAGFDGTDYFIYRVFDGITYSAPVSVTITVSGGDHAPAAVADAYSVAEDGVLAAGAPGVLLNDGDADGDTLTAVLYAGVSHGMLTLDPSGSYTYAPYVGFSGADSFAYRVFDGVRYSDPATVTITVSPPGPTAIDLTTGSSSSLGYGSTFKVAGTLSSGGSGLPARRVILQSGTSLASLKDTSYEAVTDPAGAFSFFVKPMAMTYYRVRFAGATGYAPSLTGTPVSAVPRVYLSTPAAPSTVSRSRYYTVYGYLKPRHTSGSYPVRIYKYRLVSGHWRSYGYESARVSNYSSYSRYSHSIRFPYAGKWRVWAYAPGESGAGGHAATWSTSHDDLIVR